MSNANLFKQLGVDENLKPLSIKVKQQPLEKYYKATFTPSFPPIPRFEPNVFMYASLVPGSVSVIGRYHKGDALYQITIVIDQELESGTYTFMRDEEGPVFAHVTGTQGFLYGDKGRIKLVRNNIEQSIYAEFKFQIKFGDTTYNVDGSLALLATGPL